MNAAPTDAHAGTLTLFDVAPAEGPEQISDRAYQVRGVREIVAGLQPGGRGQVIMACGTGKTKMARWAAERLVDPRGIVIIAVPSVALVDQTLREWAADSTGHRALAVCGDGSVQDDSAGAVIDILEPVTLDTDVISAWLRAEIGPALRLIVTTHHSAHLVGIGLQLAGLEAQLLVVDEAHHTAGRTSKHAALLHDDEVLPAARRLYMTATPRVAMRPRGEIDTDLFSMDDESVYGPVLFSYPFSQAIADNWLDDYRLAVIGVTRAEVAAALHRSARSSLNGPRARAAMVQIATARAANLYGLRRIIAFTRTVRDAQRFAETFPDTLEKLPRQLRPRRPLHAAHVHGDMNTAQRRRILTALTMPPEDGWSVIANARCLQEGVDVPAVDCIAFTAPKRSVVDIVQAVGRALRRDPSGSGVATILVPVLLPDGSPDDADTVDAGEFDVLWDVVRALRAHDDSFSAELDACRSSGFADRTALRRIHFDLPGTAPGSELLQHLTVRLIKSATSPWWNSYDRLREFHRRYDHVDVPAHYRDPGDQYMLGQWVIQQRRAHLENRLTPERISALSALGFDFRPGMQQRSDKHARRWRAGLEAARQYHAKHGHLNLPTDTQVNGINLSKWVRAQRARFRKGTLTRDQEDALTELGMDFDPFRHRWQQNLEAARQFYAEHGHLLPKSGADDVETPLAGWLATLRHLRRKGGLDARKIADLDKIGMSWEPAHDRWQENLAAAADFYHEHGHLHPGGDNEDLAEWLRAQRQGHARGLLPANRVAALTAIGMIWDLPAARWDVGIAATRSFLKRYGHLDVPRGHKADGLRGRESLDLHSWHYRLRAQRRAGELAADKTAELDALGFEWSPREAARDQALRLCQEFHASHGHLRVPDNYVVEGFCLGAWLHKRRAQRRDGSLVESEIAPLDQLGFDWSNQIDAKWQRSYEAARQYYNEHGTLKTPADYVTPDGMHLYKWLCKQRRLHAAGKLTHERVALLDELGMQWGEQSQWLASLSLARDFYAQHGHLRMSRAKAGPQARLALFLERQRAARAAGTLSRERIELLDEIGMIWAAAPLREQQWTRPLAQAQSYYDTHGHLDVPSTHPPSDGIHLYRWLGTQRRRYAKGLLPADRIAALTAIGMDWEPPIPGGRLWNRGWQHALAYQTEHGTFDVPNRYRTPCGFYLYGFILRLHCDYEDGKLSATKIDTVTRVGFVFRPTQRHKTG